ncbi:TolC family protein [Paucibacter sp. APW11]|uniref:TolC family protein n=1 Tax=Roseateles aquae TaxID=3077235 RepID=A0ABU3PEM9_9BURK|nr:TolC family protein [Paucibacter sp. APW11]MDT9001039.1 TolC family protein [Paucibacter sp. APW11]
MNKNNLDNKQQGRRGMGAARRGLSLLAAAAIMAMTGCAASSGLTAKPAPDVAARALALPSQWQQLDAAQRTEADWAGALDAQLAALQARALQANRDIALALKRWEAAQLQQRGAALDRGLTPSLSGTASGSRLLEQGPLTRSYGATASVSYEVDLWSRVAHQEAAQAADAEGQRSDWQAAQLLIRNRVAESYWTLASLALEQPLIEEQRRGAEAVLALTRLRVSEGKLLPIEIDRAASTLQGLDSRLAQAQRERVQQQLNLGLLLDDTAPQLPALPTLPEAAPQDWQPGAPAEVLERRPDVRRARSQVDSALARWRASEAARYPSLSLSASIGTGGAQWRDWLDKPLATLASTLVVPMVDWRRLDLQQAQAGNQLDSAALQLRDTVHKALVEIEQLAAERRELRAQGAANAARLNEAQQAERQAQLRYEVGAIARADWLQARNARLAAEQEAIQLRLRQWLNQAALHRALASG